MAFNSPLNLDEQLDQAARQLDAHGATHAASAVRHATHAASALRQANATIADQNARLATQAKTIQNYRECAQHWEERAADAERQMKELKARENFWRDRFKAIGEIAIGATQENFNGGECKRLPCAFRIF